MIKVTAKAPANIAFIKYWGKKDEALKLPLAGSISMNLDNIYTVTTVEFNRRLTDDRIEMVGTKMKSGEKQKVSEFLDRIRNIAKITDKARIKTKNNFPKGTGVASSASGFAALAVAAAKAAGLNLPEKELSILARLGSGSACRSIPDGFVEWLEGNSSQTSYAKSIFPKTHWNILDITIIVSRKEKKISSSLGHTLALESPFMAARINDLDQKIKKIKQAIGDRDFTTFGNITESDALNMHAVMMTSNPALIYWQPKTVEIMKKIIDYRDMGLETYFTIDAGPNVHIICQEKSLLKVKSMILTIKGIKQIIISRPGKGAEVTENHLF